MIAFFLLIFSQSIHSALADSESVLGRVRVIADRSVPFYNPARRHSSLDYLTPTEYEALHFMKTQAAFS